MVRKEACGCAGVERRAPVPKRNSSGQDIRDKLPLPNISDKGTLPGEAVCTCLLGPRGVNLLFSCLRTVKIISGF